MALTFEGISLNQFRYEAKQLLYSSLNKKEDEGGARKQGVYSGDRVTLGSDIPEAVTYDANGAGIDLEDQYAKIRDEVLERFQEQGVAQKVATDDDEINIESLSSDEAAELVSEGGYFGVEKTAERIFQFAVRVGGEDPERSDAIRKGIQDGFDLAEQAWGGRLPEISYETHKVVMEKLDAWVAKEEGS